VGACLMVLSGLVASSANTRTAEARSTAPDVVESKLAVDVPPTRATTSPAPLAVETQAHTRVVPASPFEIVTPPPRDLRLENPQLRRLQKAEITPAMLKLAGSIVRKHYAKPVGTQVEVELEGRRVVARIERHFHPEGGPVKPWGYHPGVSLFVTR
jgi:hypothetical protein